MKYEIETTCGTLSIRVSAPTMLDAMRMFSALNPSGIDIKKSDNIAPNKTNDDTPAPDAPPIDLVEKAGL